MKITKLGHCCLLIEEKGISVLTDPGVFTTAQNDIKELDILIITHEHPDHLHIESVKKILENSPNIAIITNSSVGNILKKENISFQIVEDMQKINLNGISIEAFGNEHAEIYGDFGRVQNTGYFFEGKFFYPGDALFVPPKQIEILALPVAGPWVKIKESIDYAKQLKPRVCFPVHDGIVSFVRPFHQAPLTILTQEGIEFVVMNAGDVKEF